MRTLPAVLLFFCAALSPLAAQSNEHWVEVQSPHFVVLTDSNEKQARRVAGQFEEMRSVFLRLIPNAAAAGDTGRPITVFALKDDRSFRSLEPAAYLAKGQLTLAGVFMRRPEKNIILVRLDAEGDHPFATVYHEYTHVIMSKATWVPLWMSEGLAEFYENSDIREKEVMLGEPNRNILIYLRMHSLIPVTTLLKVDYKSPYYHQEDKGSIFYAESWALMHYLEISDYQNRTDHLRDYARNLIAGEDSVTAAQHAFGDLDLLQQSLSNYVAHDLFLAFKMSSGFTVDTASLTSLPVAPAEVDALRAEVLINSDRAKEAEALLTSSLHTNPNNAALHEMMGYLKAQCTRYAGRAEVVRRGGEAGLAELHGALLLCGDVSAGE